ncbi:MAG: Formiminotransferase-cyclodeaminase [Firmicutes bacterium]|nr:Formiminotransferase-cyclodeaminase [Bacillota bacterium]
MLTALSISEFATKIASNEPGPGGGSAAALMGLTGASLAEMIINLTIGGDGGQESELLSEKKNELSRLHIELQLLVDRDATAFLKLVTANSMSDSSEANRQVRRDAIQDAGKEAAEVPLWTARVCLEVMEIIEEIIKLGIAPKHAISDLLVGALASHAGAIGALLNTAANLPLLGDAQLVSALKGQLILLRNEADNMIASIREQGVAVSDLAVMKE